MRIFFHETEPGAEVASGDMVLLDEAESHHLLQVIRRREGALVRLTDGRARFFDAELRGRREGRAELQIVAVEVDEEALAAPCLVLGCAVVKGKRFEWALEKCVELGVHRIVPLLTRRGVVRPGSGRQARWQTILRTALKQSGRSWLPELAEATELADLIAADPARLFWGAAADDLATVPAEGPSPIFWHRPIATGDRPDSVTALIGPEGGWSESEGQQLIAAGAVPMILGPHVLRTETAAVAAMFTLQALRRLWQES